MPGSTCPECGLVHPPVPQGQPCPVAQANNSFNIYNYMRPSINKLITLTEKYPSQREKIAIRFKTLLQQVVEKIEEEFDVASD